MDRYTLNWVRVTGYRPFGNLEARLGAPEVIVGANGSGKSSLFDLLRIVRDGAWQETTPGLLSAQFGREVFHRPGPDQLSWGLGVRSPEGAAFMYRAAISGPSWAAVVTSERLTANRSPETPDSQSQVLFDLAGGRGVVLSYLEGRIAPQQVVVPRYDQLGLATMTNPFVAPEIVLFRQYVLRWRFYSSLRIDNDRIRRPATIEQTPLLHEDAANLSSVLHYLMTEHQEAFAELQHHLGLAVPGFRGLNVKARGGPGEVIAFWREGGIDAELSLADLSDGILRLLCWLVLCLQPNPPSLVCIDEPDLGLHPSTLPILAGLFEKASERTQFLLATHSSYFLTQFDISRIAVMRKENGEARFIKPIDSKVLMANLADFGPGEIEAMHRSDELETLA